MTLTTLTPGTCYDVSQSHYEPIIHCSLVVPRLAVVRGSLVLGTGLGVSPFPWGRGHSRMAALGTHHWAWLHMGTLHPSHSRAYPPTFPILIAGFIMRGCDDRYAIMAVLVSVAGILNCPGTVQGCCIISICCCCCCCCCCCLICI